MADPKALYQEVILDHNRKPRNYGTLPSANHHAEGHNPLCGDRIDVALALDDDKIGAIAFEGESCAICKASASMMTVAVKGRSRAEAETLIREFREMAIGKIGADGLAHLGRLSVFAGVRDLPTRVKCAILPWHTLSAALNAVAKATTEADDDPMHAPIGGA
ncbi:MAG TPA: SUF system NifU family Fe-S cluster assembly protein [Casimicrobiaceae bacterium]|nr:SUF system NifU family Fe-S cluster assembly protein [Casimicrobiaceae bacterium]